jgi:hypothetical protein
MEPKTNKATEFDKFTSLVDSVLSIPKADVERIKSEPWPEEKKDRLLGYLKQDIEDEQRRKSQVIPNK